MSAALAGLLTFAIVSAAAILGMLLSPRINQWADAKEVTENLKSSMTIVATMTSLVLGLLVNSSYAIYAEAEKDVQRYASTLILADQALIGLGEDACVLRPELQRYATAVVASVWPGSTGTAEEPLPILLNMMQKAQPLDGKRKEIRGLLQDQGDELVSNAWKIRNYSSGRMTTFFLGAIIFWLALVYGGVGMAMPRSRLAIGGTVFTAAGVALAIFLAAEMAEPFGGPLRVARTALVDAIALMKAQPCPAAL